MHHWNKIPALLAIILISYQAFAQTSPSAPAFQDAPVATANAVMKKGNNHDVQVWFYEQLKARNFEAIEKFYSGLQAAYERGEIDDITLDYVTQAPNDAPLTLEDEALYDAWCQTYPQSYMARLLRANYHYNVGWNIRGTAFASKTSSDNFEGYFRELFVAQDDLVASLALTQKPILTYARMISIASQARRFAVDSPEALLARVNQLDSNNYAARWAYLRTLRPRWGGSYEQMQAAIEQTRREGLSGEKLDLLRSAIPEDQALAAVNQGDYATALPLYREAALLQKPFLFKVNEENGFFWYANLSTSANVEGAATRSKVFEYSELMERLDVILAPARGPFKMRGFYSGIRGMLLREQAHANRKKEFYMAAWNDFVTGADLGDDYSAYEVAAGYCQGLPGFIEYKEEDCRSHLVRAATLGSGLAAQIAYDRWHVSITPAPKGEPQLGDITAAAKAIPAERIPYRQQRQSFFAMLWELLLKFFEGLR